MIPGSQAWPAAGEPGLDSQVRFEVASAHTFNGGPYDLVTSFDCVHDMGDPLGAAQHIRQMLAPDVPGRDRPGRRPLPRRGHRPAVIGAVMG
jgi:hypothetical protein